MEYDVKEKRRKALARRRDDKKKTKTNSDTKNYRALRRKLAEEHNQIDINKGDYNDE